MTLTWDGTDEDLAHVSCCGGHRPYAFGEHRHRGFWELVCVRHGILEHTLNGVCHSQGPGAFAVVRECDRHALAGERVAYVNVSFTVVIPTALRSLPRVVGDCLHQLDAVEPIIGVLPSAERQGFHAACDGLAARLRQADAGARLVELLLRLLRCAGGKPEPQLPTWLAQVLPLSDGVGEVPDLPGLVRRSGVSHEHLARQMRRHLGLTPRQFLARCRVDRAARLLAVSDGSVGEIAMCCGFPTLSALDRTFVRERGLSPGAWRRQEQRFIGAGR